ncbi:MAG: hypothetical protein ACRECO_17755 [Xanthobacteraceae bacterium]
MHYEIAWSPGKVYELVAHDGRALAGLVMEGSFWTPERSATMSAGSRRWTASRAGVFKHHFTLADDQGKVTSAENDAFYSCDLTLPIGSHVYRFQTRGWMINYMTISEDNRDIVDVHNRWLRFWSNAGDASFFTAAQPNETHLLAAMFGFYQLRVFEYSSSS